MTRRERAIQRAMQDAVWRDGEALITSAIEGAIRLYEAELAADLESEEMARRVVDEFLGCASFDRVVKISKIDEAMRAALKAVLEDQ